MMVGAINRMLLRVWCAEPSSWLKNWRTGK